MIALGDELMRKRFCLGTSGVQAVKAAWRLRGSLEGERLVEWERLVIGAVAVLVFLA
jgi:hypothetical protein